MESTKTHRYGINADGTPWKTLPKHTPGPWRVGSKQTASPSYIDAGHGFNYRLITRVHDVDTDEGEANARLIAAAPDLLAACKAFAYAQRLGRIGGDFAVMEQIQAAIAKATGDV